MAKKPYVQKLETFPQFYWRLARYVQKNGRFSAELLSKSELMSERLRLYRWINSMQWFARDDPLTPFLAELEIRHNIKTMVLEVVHKPVVIRNLEKELDKAEQGEYNMPVVDQTADAMQSLFEQMKRERIQFDGEDDEGK